MKSTRSLLMALPLLVMLAGVGQAQHCFLKAVNLNFGAYDPISAAPLDTVGQLRVDCRPPSWSRAHAPVYSIALNPGLHSAGQFRPRKMAKPIDGAVMAYNLYRDPSRSQIWGDGTNSTFVVQFAPNRRESEFESGRRDFESERGGRDHDKHRFVSTLYIYGRIPPQQNAVTVGQYSDTVTVTISF